MKNIILLFAFLVGCSGTETLDTHDADEARVITEYDAGPENEGSDVVSNEGNQYACAKVYLQIPYETRDSDTGDISVILSHQLWSIPVRRSALSEENKWYAVMTEFNHSVPISNNVNFEDGEEAYAILLLEDGTTLYDQVVLPAVDNTWQVCESLYCGQAGCQLHEEFEHESWSCQITQNRTSVDKCPCTFNNTGYPYCDVYYGKKETEE